MLEAGNGVRAEVGARAEARWLIAACLELRVEEADARRRYVRLIFCLQEPCNR